MNYTLKNYLADLDWCNASTLTPDHIKLIAGGLELVYSPLLSGLVDEEGRYRCDAPADFTVLQDRGYRFVHREADQG